MAKLVASETAVFCADSAVQILGGDGLAREYGRAEQIYRDARALTIVDRREAIHQAIAAAGVGDVVLVAGKGHEKYQVIGGTTFPFDDVAVAREALSARRQTSGVG